MRRTKEITLSNRSIEHLQCLWNDWRGCCCCWWWRGGHIFFLFIINWREINVEWMNEWMNRLCLSWIVMRICLTASFLVLFIFIQRKSFSFVFLSWLAEKKTKENNHRKQHDTFRDVRSSMEFSLSVSRFSLVSREKYFHALSMTKLINSAKASASLLSSLSFFSRERRRRRRPH